MRACAVVGGGPAGLIAAETLARAGQEVRVFDHMPSVGRKLLIAGRGGLNLTHSEPLGTFLGRYGAARARLHPAIEKFPPAALVEWAEGLGQATFVGSSGRVFPRAMKASPLLRAWLRRLEELGVAIATRHRLVGIAPGSLRFATPEGARTVPAAATVLALGGASWPRLGSDGGWTALLPGVPVVPFAPANCGFTVAWSAHFASRFAGQPLKRIAARCGAAAAQGEAMLTQAGIEGGAIYALGPAIRAAIAQDGHARLVLDLRPDLAAHEVAARLAAGGALSLSNRLRRLGLSPAAIGLVQEVRHLGAASDPATLVKALPLSLGAPFAIARAISSAGGIAWDSVGEDFSLRGHPGLFVAGEMLDWEAPTGGYLLQACFATGVAAAEGALASLAAAA